MRRLIGLIVVLGTLIVMITVLTYVEHSIIEPNPDTVIGRVPVTNTSGMMRVIKYHPLMEFHDDNGAVTHIRPLEVADDEGVVRTIFDYDDSFIGEPKPGDRVLVDMQETNDFISNKHMLNISAVYLVTRDEYDEL